MNAFVWRAGALCIAVFSTVAAAQSNPWNGQWKADPASLKYMGPEFKVTTDANGYTVTRGSETTKFVCDGKPQNVDDTMVSCTKSGNGYTMDATRNGKHVRHTTLTFSADGKTRTSKSDITPPDGSPYTMTSVATRVSGTTADGTWRETKVQSSDDNGTLLIEVNGGTAKFKETDYPSPLECKLDGSKTPLPIGGSVALKLADPHTLKVTYRDDKDKLRRENTFVLSADGKSITETDVTPAPSESKMTLTLHKM